MAYPLKFELTQFFAGKTGRRFASRDVARAGEDWDAVVWDLLEGTASEWVRGVKRGSNSDVFLTRSTTRVPALFAQLAEEVPEFEQAWAESPIIGEEADSNTEKDSTPDDQEALDTPAVLHVTLSGD